MKRMRRGRGRREVRERKRLACTVNSAREKTDAMTTTEVTLRVYDLRCDDETKRRASETLDASMATRRRDDDDR